MSLRRAVSLFGEHAFWSACVLAVVVGGCSSGGTSGPDGGLDASTEGGAETGPGGDAGDDGAAPMLSCQGIRLCLAAGGTATDCAARGTTEGRAAFQPLLDCLTAHCSDQSASCFCREACQQPDGYCLDQTDACVAASATTVDAVCGQFCGG